MATRISVFNSRELQAVLVAMKALDRDTKKHIRRELKSMAEPEWKEAVAANAEGRLEQRVLASTARVAVSDQNVQLKSAAIGRSMSGGAKPSEIYGPVEFGSGLRKTTYSRRSKNGGSHKVTRTTGRQFRPPTRSGWVVYPAAARLIPRIAALYVQTLVRGVHEAFESR